MNLIYDKSLVPWLLELFRPTFRLTLPLPFLLFIFAQSTWVGVVISVAFGAMDFLIFFNECKWEKHVSSA